MRRVFLKITGVLLLAVALAFGWFWNDYRAFQERPLAVGEAGADFTVEKGASLQGIARRLGERGILERPRYLVLLGRLAGNAQQIQAGEYHIAPGTTPAQFLDAMVRGQVIQYALTLVEGWNFREVMAAVSASEHLEHTLSGASPEEIMTAIGRSGEHPEGRFFPDTYHFPRGLSDREFLQRAYEAMEEHLTREWANRSEDLPFESAYEALTMASIVEKETGVPGERPEIAGVFIRRLEKGMRLQTDPTVIYGMGEAYDGNIRRRDLETYTPYNTYRISGLPPTPIAMPGAEALHAVMHPADGNALYFVSKGDGSHYFSSTLEEHNAAVRKYQLRR